MVPERDKTARERKVFPTEVLKHLLVMLDLADSIIELGSRKIDFIPWTDDREDMLASGRAARSASFNNPGLRSRPHYGPRAYNTVLLSNRIC